MADKIFIVLIVILLIVAAFLIGGEFPSKRVTYNEYSTGFDDGVSAVGYVVINKVTVDEAMKKYFKYYEYENDHK